MLLPLLLCYPSGKAIIHILSDKKNWTLSYLLCLCCVWFFYASVVTPITMLEYSNADFRRQYWRVLITSINFGIVTSQGRKRSVKFIFTFYCKMTCSSLVNGIAIGMLMCNRSAFQIRKEWRISRSQMCWKEERNLKRRKGLGRPWVTNWRTDRALVLKTKQNCFESIPRLFVSWASTGMQCSVRTTRRHLLRLAWSPSGRQVESL